MPTTRLFALWPETITEIADAALAAVALEARHTVATFDTRLSKKLRALGAEIWTS